MSLPIEWNYEKNGKAERALSRINALVATLQMVQLWITQADDPGIPDEQETLLTEAELMEVLRLALDTSRELRTLIEQILPNWLHWEAAEAARQRREWEETHRQLA